MTLVNFCRKGYSFDRYSCYAAIVLQFKNQDFTGLYFSIGLEKDFPEIQSNDEKRSADSDL
jgi:hypothetical protein